MSTADPAITYRLLAAEMETERTAILQRLSSANEACSSSDRALMQAMIDNLTRKIGRAHQMAEACRPPSAA